MPPISDGPPPHFVKLMANPSYDLPMPPQLTHDQAQPMALTMAGLLHWMARAAPDDFAICRSAAEVRAAINA